MRRRLRRRPAAWKALTPKTAIWKALGSSWLGGFACSSASAWIPLGKVGIVLVPTEAGWVGRYTLPPLLQGHPPHPDAPLLLASLRRAPGWAP